MRRSQGDHSRAGLWASICLFLAASSHAQEAVPSPRRTKSEEHNFNLVNTFKDTGVAFPVTVTAEIFGNLSGGTSRTAIWESLLEAGIEIDFEKAARLKGFSLSVSALYPQGTSLTNKAVHDFNTLSNIDAYDSVRLYEAWVQQEFDDGRFSIRLGQILADAEFFDSDYAALFINSSFGTIPLVSKNLNPPIFPVAAPGVRLRFVPRNSFYAQAAAFSGDVGEASTTNKHNTRFYFRAEDGVLVFAEIGYKLNPREEELAPPTAAGKGRDSNQLPPLPNPGMISGTYKLGGYYDSGEFSDSGGGSPHHGDYSIYFIADQELWHPEVSTERALSFFTRIGVAPNDKNTVTFYADTGFNYKGILANRDKDTLGLGFSYAQLSRDLIDDSGRKISNHHEAVLELTYQAEFGGRFLVQPDLQCIFDPGAVKPGPTAVVTGIRMTVRF